ncbi:3D-(3,5/4)-trihydroxycyclohexane-1,2-dione acylhydrolase (decyclizing) [Asticcacaulis sp. 201]|uniref:3D-(3,5/4)-trihydroxycyclohexane-1,2-dione acylhydrolase (decyclizing) n=1 Tax=Asticcacaulis sp. 201 TaxID=3028787 RepID=UPI00291600D4|nr:3D-(3,5/4)-trihydroxycyclohexane-1,2-dione acylhydrolase (decyclizing) [Asticcacaulis sp. 201]MDV6331211.1 3D-(3,5/4)-trihydroxycyclohexane-1,2-dione acylhydrolase (decyclizing) [Asticcacaulis sp. 201]
MAQALVRYLSQQFIVIDGEEVPYFAGVWAIFGHGNVAGMGEALQPMADVLPTYRAHNEQAMAHAAIAFSKQTARRRAMACTTSIGPGATNMVTAAALAHVNRLPVLFLPGDVYANRRPDPVLQQIEAFDDATVSANDCFRPVSRYFDRITRPEQILKALPAAMNVLLDPAQCGPVTLALCQDIQAESFDYPEAFFARKVWRVRAPQPDPRDVADAVSVLKTAKSPMLIAGGGVKYSGAEAVLADFVTRHGLVFGETQAGKGAIPWHFSHNMGGVGVTGTEAANQAVRRADVVIGVGTRLQDFTTGSAALFNPQARLIQINANLCDAAKFDAISVQADAGAALTALSAALGDWTAPADSLQTAQAYKTQWNDTTDRLFAASDALPTDAQVLGALERALDPDTVMVCAAGGLPGELHKLWRVREAGAYHLEYGFSCMGYEIAGSVGVKLAEPQRPVCVVVGDGSYLMMNSEIATAVMLGLDLIIVVVDNRGFGCIDRLQRATGGVGFNNLLKDARHHILPAIDFSGHARALGAKAGKAGDLAELEAAVRRAQVEGGVQVVVIDTDPATSTAEGGAWWDVAVPQTSDRTEVRNARAAYDDKLNEIKRKPQA